MAIFKPFVCVFTLLIYIWVVFFMDYFYLPKDWIFQWWSIPLIATIFISIIPLIPFFFSETTDTKTMENLKVEILVYLNKEIYKIESDDRFNNPKANTQVNAPVDLVARHRALTDVLNYIEPN